jgi:SAM-dependent methyltransferase
MAYPAANLDTSTNTSQYDALSKISFLKSTPSFYGMYLSILREILGNIDRLHVLDMACGAGNVSQKLLEWGAEKVTGVDNSGGKIGVAQSMFRGTPGLDFSIADCSKPFDKGHFDLVTGFWLLNYARDRDDLSVMWSNISRHLKPGGRFVGVVPNYELLEAKNLGLLTSGHYHFGEVNIQILDRLEDGFRIQTTFHMEPSVSVTNYILQKSLHEHYAYQAGLRDIQWIEPGQMDMRPLYPRSTSCTPVFQFVTATRPKA